MTTINILNGTNKKFILNKKSKLYYYNGIFIKK